MSKFLLLFIFILATTQAITFDLTRHCACEELNESECHRLYQVCKWTTTCETILSIASFCSSLQESSCTKLESYYQCVWENKACVEKTYTCDDFKTNPECTHELDCWWNKSGKCASFTSCVDYDESNCNRSGCEYISGACTQITCSSFQSDQDCKYMDSQHSFCRWTDDNKCQPLSTTATCTDLSSYKFKCEDNFACKYESNQCSFRTCAEIIGKYNNCRTLPISGTEKILCSWDGTTCADAEDASELTESNCFEWSAYNYRWTSDNKCEACDTLVSFGNSTSAAIIPVFFAIAFIT
ncbi:unnamed protein product (macronuclear) [Paramecium tetraurelia]|uniref:Mini antigen n=1 Tax=Paramecium tetraurelia TaxID=5888 RepID=A0DFP7_PARTE|nr:uncharacterized protein GSPATT00016677001 [Paramecium tetraurelia]CAK81864.1 unnamed protein product [Paramecium tetraurelia]|eukprot:XP_001449261.1 hypothetical protein (macronuclear) [Paramecium tetraurelia strain d4-2]